MIVRASRTRYGGAMHDEWLARWRDGKIGFHEGRPNDLLARHLARLARARRVLVPLCGKTEDLAFLAANDHDVVGIELAEQAVSAFFAEHGLAPAITQRGPFTVYTAGAITLLAGDIFAATAELVGPVDGLYDRAALVALPDTLRPSYAALLRRGPPPSSRPSCARCIPTPRSISSRSASRPGSPSAQRPVCRRSSAASRSGRVPLRPWGRPNGFPPRIRAEPRGPVGRVVPAC